ncbi:hypothetical protein [Microcoleus sp. bin38.metabat.b11b12b14.051]|uniref:hypothetical protein n=1 Tax=Microcoleus sp. bin38.metabat.b11b12b14.051 TaxID=2742709 RepID=UPI0025E28CEB|nr:hypothetical protein [Microcoleus sp. bin38.metabat.b11b12b14.051]
MERETQDVIDVEAEQIDCPGSESISRWYSAAQIQSVLGLNKAALQKAITKLTSIYDIELKSLRRGSARATEYSQTALDALELLGSGKLSDLRRFVDEIPATVPIAESSAIVFLDRHNEIAVTSASAADDNLTQINSLKSGLLNSYRELGRTLGRQAAAEVRQGFTDEVRAGLESLQES